ncbi:glucokinase [Flagellimonas beolgyonensis]|uniref:glucokinase n=1 Tax=Flagellimonas beolgyonensis TaxID=864064 RepID=UPI003D656FB7
MVPENSKRKWLVPDQVPVGPPPHPHQTNPKGLILAGDIGGTKTNLALFQVVDNHLITLKEHNYRTKDFDSFIAMARDFLTDMEKPDRTCLGVAGPVVQGRVHGTNFPWDLDTRELSHQLQWSPIFLINDMEANAYGLSLLAPSEFEPLQKGSGMAGNAVLMSPGTGLGEAGLYWDGTTYLPFATEGGHADFSPRKGLDIDLWHYLHKKYGHVSWERVLCGKGIHDLYEFLGTSGKFPESQEVSARFSLEDPAAVITREAMAGNDDLCRETLMLFIRYTAIEASQLALKFKAMGGVYLGGGIAPKILPAIQRDTFHAHFLGSGRMDELLENIPIKVILNERTALLGAARYAATH